MALSPEKIAELERLKALMRQPASEFQRQAQAIGNAEKMGIPVTLPTDKKANGGQISQDAMQYALLNKGGGLEKFLEPSKVKGRMYHATPKDFSEFDESKPTFVTHDPNWASKWALTDRSMGLKSPPWVLGTPRPWQVMPVYAQVSNPFDYENPEHLSALENLVDTKHMGSLNNSNNWRHMERKDVQDAIKKLGHDSFYVSETGTKNLGVYNPRKIKSAIGNRGTYDTKERDITKAHGGSVTHAHQLDIEERPL